MTASIDKGPQTRGKSACNIEQALERIVRDGHRALAEVPRPQ